MSLLIIGLLLVLLFGGLGFALHILWVGMLIGLAVIVVHALSRS